MPAGHAECSHRVVIHQPIADIIAGIVTKPYLTWRPGKLLPSIALGLERRQGEVLRQITEPVRATLATGILEIQNLPATLAFEQLHTEAPRSFRLIAVRPCWAPLGTAVTIAP